MTFVVHADTPEDLRSELLEWFKTKHLDATRRAGVKNQSPRTTYSWAVRANVIAEAAAFIKDLKIEPKVDELRSGPGIGGRYPRPLCTHCKGSGRLDYTITNHGERNEVVRDKCHYCNGEGREPPTRQGGYRND